MKKKLILILCLALSLFCTGCDKKNNSEYEQEHIISKSNVSEFNTQDEMAQYIISHKDDIFPIFFKHDTQKSNPDNLRFYSWGNVSDGYELKSVYQCGEKITMTYENDTETQPIKFTWKFSWDGDVYTQSTIFVLRLEEMENLKGYYYTISKDENGEDFCDIYWYESGYAFEIQGPASWADDKDLTISLNTTDYPIAAQSADK